MKRQLKLSISKELLFNRAMKCRQFSIREKFLKFLFGKKQDIIVLILSNRVKKLSVDKKGEAIDE